MNRDKCPYQNSAKLSATVNIYNSGVARSKKKEKKVLQCDSRKQIQVMYL